MRNPALCSFALGGLAALLIGCRTAPEPLPQETAACPADINSAVRLFASSAPRAIPTDPGSGQEIGRTLTIAVRPGPAARGLRLASSDLTITTAGGTFETWAQAREGSRGSADIDPLHALDIIPGRLRVSPFLSGARLAPQTVYIDVTIVPGALPIDEMAVKTASLWDGERRPIDEDAVEVSLEPLRHYRMHDGVEATVALAFVAARSRSFMPFQCSVESRMTLVQHEDAIPPLWDLRLAVPNGRIEWWLALFDGKSGPFRAIFSSPADAQGFASWLHQTHATRVGPFQLGLFRPNYAPTAARTVPTERFVIDSFRAAAPGELDTMVMGRLGEP